MVREMSLPQIRAALDACDRRDADLALRNLETTHAANAPLQCGKDGNKVYDACVKFLRRIINPAYEQPQDDAFAKMVLQAQLGPKAPPLKLPERPAYKLKPNVSKP